MRHSSSSSFRIRTWQASFRSDRDSQGQASCSCCRYISLKNVCSLFFIFDFSNTMIAFRQRASVHIWLIKNDFERRTSHKPVSLHDNHIRPGCCKNDVKQVIIRRRGAYEEVALATARRGGSESFLPISSSPPRIRFLNLQKATRNLSLYYIGRDIEHLVYDLKEHGNPKKWKVLGLGKMTEALSLMINQPRPKGPAETIVLIP
jgi:hypothetical protein